MGWFSLKDDCAQRRAVEKSLPVVRGCCEEADHLRSAATLSMPALAQASSFSPPGAPDTPTAPIVSLPILIGSAPCAGVMFVRKSAPAFGLPLTPAANSPDDLEKVRAV